MHCMLKSKEQQIKICCTKYHRLAKTLTQTQQTLYYFTIHNNFTCRMCSLTDDNHSAFEQIKSVCTVNTRLTANSNSYQLLALSRRTKFPWTWLLARRCCADGELPVSRQVRPSGTWRTRQQTVQWCHTSPPVLRSSQSWAADRSNCQLLPCNPQKWSALARGQSRQRSQTQCGQRHQQVLKWTLRRQHPAC